MKTSPPDATRGATRLAMMVALLISRFQSLMDGGQLSVIIDRGRKFIQLPQDRRIEIVMLPNLDVIATTQVPG